MIADRLIEQYKNDMQAPEDRLKYAKLLSMPLPLEGIFKSQMTAAPKSKATSRKTEYEHKYAKDYAYAFLVPDGDFSQEFAVRTYKTLKKHVEAGHITHITYNTFYRNDRKLRSNLRWINAMCIEIDVKGKENVDNKGITLVDVLGRISNAGLPEATTILKSPSGGYHILWVYQNPIRATRKAAAVYTRMQKAIAQAIGGDLAAVGAEHYFRAPNKQNVVYEGYSVPSNSLTDWYAIDCERRFAERGDRFSGAVNFNTYNGALMQSEAFRDVQRGGFDDMRDRVSFSLACAYKLSGMTEREASVRLLSWNANNVKRMSQSKLLTKIRSVYRSEERYVSYSFIKEAAEYLTGKEYPEKIYWNSRMAKPRSERVRSHYYEYKQDIIEYLKIHEALIGSQRSIAKELQIPFSTFCKVLKNMIEEGLLIMETKKGRGGFTLITLPSKQDNPTKPHEKPLNDSKGQQNGSDEISKEDHKQPAAIAQESHDGKINVLLSNNTGKGAGGQALLGRFSEASASTTSAFTTVPSCVPAFFVSAFSHRGFSDGRFIFAAWGRVRLAFSSLGIRPSALAGHSDYVSLACASAAAAFDYFGTPIAHDWSGDSDRFLKYFYGVVRKKLATFRQNELENLRQYMESIPLARLFKLWDELSDESFLKWIPDRENIELFLTDLEAEIRKREIQNARRKWFEKFGLSALK
ncbi:hypothetical protein [Bacillus safensis]|uniref:hypothetical protein n=1 Tax=Bacillus safensis TaxID=561879 RepID=UPI00090BA804|nr:hypothetical protein [Bacillus safensis]APJ13348.1 hypothetical protein BSL056_20335 [Bacillus safensis]